ncbi:hypothetical protein QFZ34_000468 [Phyllobacterium ifriqiyense]|uniref:Uncharacterized protein n=1 Tax=Phyllobacterium ifriqiyense TaxID=314238 RepID=A0ABU0S3T8_9HYPH|nr:hypothetical protein [Phyllobacterium ifriqiyense]
MVVNNPAIISTLGVSFSFETNGFRRARGVL